jgi:alpha-L-fucosidase
MSKVIKVLNKINDSKAVELKAAKIELGLIDDLKKEMRKANQGIMKAIDMANAAKKHAESSEKLNKSLLKQFQSVRKKAKDLGANDAVTTIDKQIDQLKTNQKEISKTLNGLHAAT